MSVGAKEEYNFLVGPIKAAKRTPDFISAEIAKGANVEETLKKYIDLQLTPEEIASVNKAAATKKQVDIDNAIEAIFDKRTFTGWTTGGHTGEDVNVYAYGPGKEQFAGLIDNTHNAEVIFEILGKAKK